MKLMFVSTECAPFIKTGGLGDVIGALPLSLKDKLDDQIVVIPLFKKVKDKYFDSMKKVGKVEFTMSWRKQKADIYTLEMNDVKYYFVENDYYFYRDNIYGGFDEIERYAFFDFASLELLKLIGYHPDIIHVHDWQTAMIPVLYKETYRLKEGYEKIRTMLTIHNPAFQGFCQREALGNLFNLPYYLYDNGVARFGDSVSTLKSGIMYSDYLSTVSPTNAKELLRGDYAYGLEAVLKYRKDDFFGILNGIDYVENNPSKDNLIEANYTFSTFNKKSKNKADIQKTFSIDVAEDKMVLGVVSRLANQKGINLITNSIPWIVKNNMQLVILGSGDKELEKSLQYYRDMYPNNVGVYIGFSNELAHKVYAGCDMFLMPSLYEPCGLSQMISQRYGTVPLVREVGGLKDSVEPYNEYTKTGTGFSLMHYSGEDMRKVLYYASNIYFNKKDEWMGIVEQCMKKNNSWSKSASEYLKVYNNLLKYK
jgi:starch synthase